MVGVVGLIATPLVPDGLLVPVWDTMPKATSNAAATPLTEANRVRLRRTCVVVPCPT